MNLQLFLIRERFEKHPVLSAFLKNFSVFFYQGVLPQELVMLTLEFHSVKERVCEIAGLVSNEDEHLGRREKYGNCIFSVHAQNRGEIILLEDVKANPAYLALEDQVNSEMFYEVELENELNLILNAEFFSMRISKAAKAWFKRLLELLSENV